MKFLTSSRLMAPRFTFLDSRRHQTRDTQRNRITKRPTAPAKPNKRNIQNKISNKESIWKIEEMPCSPTRIYISQANRSASRTSKTIIKSKSIRGPPRSHLSWKWNKFSLIPKKYHLTIVQLRKQIRLTSRKLKNAIKAHSTRNAEENQRIISNVKSEEIELLRRANRMLNIRVGPEILIEDDIALENDEQDVVDVTQLHTVQERERHMDLAFSGSLEYLDGVRRISRFNFSYKNLSNYAFFIF